MGTRSLDEALQAIQRPTRDAQLAAMLNQIENFRPDAWDCEKIIEALYGALKRNPKYPHVTHALVAMLQAIKALEVLDQGGEPTGYEEVCEVEAFKAREASRG
jgi:hypothetical protein